MRIFSTTLQYRQFAAAPTKPALTNLASKMTTIMQIYLFLNLVKNILTSKVRMKKETDEALEYE